MHPIEIDAVLKLAKNALRSSRIGEAETMYQRVLKEQPHCAEALHFFGLAAMARGRFQDAVGLVRRSIELAPDRPDYHNNLATVLGRMNAPVEAFGAAQRAIDLQSDFAEAWSNKGVALEKLGRGEEAVAAYRQAIAAAHGETRGHGDAEIKGQRDRGTKGQSENSALTNEHPALVNALANLGNALSAKDEHEEAAALLRRVAELRPREGGARKNLGNALRRAGKPQEAVTAYRMATELNPRDADAFNNLGAALQESGKVREAETALRSCLSINANHPDAHWNLGLALLSMGKWQEGWVNYEWRRHLREDAAQQRKFPQPVWQGSPVGGMHVLVLCEQGLGDTIQFIRYVPLLAARGARVTVECQGKLKPLLACLNTDAETRGHGDAERPRQGDKERGRQGEGQKTRPDSALSTQHSALEDAGAVRVIARGEPLPDFDVHARLMTLPCIFGSTPDDVPNEVPYLSVDDKRVAELREQLRRGDAETRGHGDITDRGIVSASSRPRVLASATPTLRVGLVWQGNTSHKGDRFRSIPLSAFAPLAQTDGVQLVSLQKGPGCEQIEQCQETIKLIEWSDPNDLTAEALIDTAAMIENLDLVITVDTAVAHLAGALGVPVWMATPLAADWRWLIERQDTPWYPTMRLFRQRKLGCWDDVIERITEALREQTARRGDARTRGRGEELALTV